MKLAVRLAAAVVILMGSSLSYAGKHPVPLEKNVDSAKCLECHEDKTKGKLVHAAVQTGCLTCHFVRVNGENTNIVLKNPNTITLCTSCHDDKKLTSAKGPIHPPVKSNCVTCHEPHVSENAALLKKATSGDKVSNLCLSCHTQGATVAEKGSRHAALDMGCDSCHVTHKSGERGNAEFKYHLKKVSPALCADCHDLKDANLLKSHNGQPFAGSNCIQCHDPHQSSSPKLLQANLHQPFEDRTSCNTCHEPAVDGKVKLNQADVKSVCLTCHDEVGKSIDAAKAMHAGAQGSCTDCHDPHAGKAPRFMKGDGVQTCLSCHSDQAEMLTKKAVLHDPAFNQKCSICHEGHGGTREKLLRADAADLCIQCHGPDAKALPDKGGLKETILGKAVELPVGYVAKSPKIQLTGKMTGHPLTNHPVTGQDPRDPNKKISCLTCHNPHAGERKNMLTSEGGTQRALCSSCHKEQR